MRAEKQLLAQEYLERIQQAPYFFVVDYRGLTVAQFSELRRRLASTGAEVHVVKNSLFRLAVKEAGVADLAGALSGQLAVVSGQKDISAAAKTLRNFHAEFDKPKLQFGYMDNERLETEQILVLAALPSLEVLRGRLAGVVQGPARQLARLLNTPGRQLASVIQAWVDQNK